MCITKEETCKYQLDQFTFPLIQCLKRLPVARHTLVLVQARRAHKCFGCLVKSSSYFGLLQVGKSRVEALIDHISILVRYYHNLYSPRLHRAMQDSSMLGFLCGPSSLLCKRRKVDQPLTSQPSIKYAWLPLHQNLITLRLYPCSLSGTTKWLQAAETS